MHQVSSESGQGGEREVKIVFQQNRGRKRSCLHANFSFPVTGGKYDELCNLFLFFLEEANRRVMEGRQTFPDTELWKELVTEVFV